MQFSPQQQQALDAVNTWLRYTDTQVLYLAGYAGTGKTTLAKYLQASYYAAFTGKAASVLRSKGCPDATTIHSLIYHPKSKSEKRLMELLQQQQAHPSPATVREIERERENLRKPSFTLNLESPLRRAKLLVVDECSMVDEQVGTDLLSFGCKVLVLGDPFQLPPVYGGGYFTNRTPDVLLTEIHRQARGNPVLDLATRLRTNGYLPRSHTLVRPRRNLQPQDMLAVDQLIVGRNNTRHTINQKMRTLLGYTGPAPQPGERVVCLRNNHLLGILNGALYQVVAAHYASDCVSMVVLDETTGQHIDVAAHPEPFLGEKVDYRTAMDMDSFDYGYALTCHKSQGSQWNSVGVLDESGAFKQNAARWLYTAITRAAEDLWVAV